MISTGLVSVTFRRLTPQDIVGLVVRTGQQCIEWGGDIHVPHGDLKRAREVAALTGDAGLKVAAYGSYYRTASPDGPSFEAVIETALALGAPIVRVWAGSQGSRETSPDRYMRIVEDSRRIASMAQEARVAIAFEFHPNTLTDTAESAVQLYRAINNPGITSYWQPSLDEPEEERLNGLQQVLPYLSNLHVFHWTRTSAGNLHRPLAAGIAPWQQYLSTAASTGRDHAAMLEFVAADSPEQYLVDARVLQDLVEQRD